MTNFEYYKTEDKALEAYAKESGEHVYNLGGSKNGTSAGRFVEWLYQERSSIEEAAYRLMREAMIFGFTTQTQANDRLHRFIKALKCGEEEWQNECAINLDKILGETWTIDAVRKAMAYAIYIIGRHNLTGVFKVLSDVEKTHGDKSANKDVCKKHEDDDVTNYKIKSTSGVDNGEKIIDTNEKVCFGGKTTDIGCPYCKNGYCTLTVLTSYPPQYQKCDFNYSCGSMYKLCSEVDK